MCYVFFIHSSIDEHLGCFRVLAVAKSAAVNIGVHAMLDESWTYIKITGRNINNLRCRGPAQPPQDPGKPEGETASAIDWERER